MDDPDVPIYTGCSAFPSTSWGCGSIHIRLHYGYLITTGIKEIPTMLYYAHVHKHIQCHVYVVHECAMVN